MTKEILKQKFVEQCKPIIVINVNYYDVDDLITNYFNPKKLGKKEYECAAYEEWCNDEDHKITIQKRQLKSYELKAVKEARLGKWEHYRLAVYLTHLCNEDVIPEGNYLIRVSY